MNGGGGPSKWIWRSMQTGLAWRSKSRPATRWPGIARSLDWLETACAERDPNMLATGISPIFDPLRAEPRFQALLRKMNLPQ